MNKMLPAQLFETQNWRLRSTLRALHHDWPDVFDKFLPLKLGIHSDIINSGLGLTREGIEEALDFHVNSYEYIKNAAQDGSCRVDLKGNHVELVSERDRDFAKRKLNEF